MKLSIKEPIGYKLTTLPDNNSKGQVVDFLVDQKTWKISYIVVNKGGIIDQSIAYIPSKYIHKVDFQDKTIRTILNQKEFVEFDVADEVDTISEVVKQKFRDQEHQMRFWERRFYPPATIPSITHNYFLPVPKVRIPSSLIAEKDIATNIRSIKEMLGYDLYFKNGKSMTVKDFVIDTISWRIKKLVIAEKFAMPWQKKYLIKMDQIERVSYVEQAVYSNKELEYKADLDEFNINKPINQNTYGIYFDYRGVVQEK